MKLNRNHFFAIIGFIFVAFLLISFFTNSCSQSPSGVATTTSTSTSSTTSQTDTSTTNTTSSITETTDTVTTSSTTTTVTLNGFTISGTVLVPASQLSNLSVAGISASRIRAMADSDELPPPEGTIVGAYDPINETLIATATVNAHDGSYSIDLSSGTNLGVYTLQVTYTGPEKTLLLQAMGELGSSVPINPQATSAFNCMQAKMMEKAGDLLTNATTLPAGTKAEALELMRTL